MIVEDEPLIRTGLKHYFSWAELGVHNIVEAENGKVGITTALRERPDLVITDIRMPEMDGLQMIEHIRDSLPDTLFIILTGFNDFGYAQKAIKLGSVHAFLLKPLEYEESLLVIQDCISKLHLKRQERIKRSKLEGGQLIKLLLEDEDTLLDANLISELCHFNSDNYLFQPFVLAGFPLREIHSQSTMWMREQAEPNIHTLAEVIFPAHIHRHIFTYSTKAKLYGLAILDTEHLDTSVTLEDHLQTKLNHNLKVIGLEHHVAPFMSIGRITSDSLQLNNLLRDTDKMLYQRFYQKDGNLFYAAELRQPRSTKSPLIQLEDTDKKKIVSCMESANEMETLELMHRLAQDILSKIDVSSPDIWLAFLQEIISVIIRFANRHSIHIEGVYSEKLLNLSFVDDFRALEDMFDWLGRWMIHLGVVYNEGLTHNQQQDVIIFEHIKSFIREYIDQDITLQMIADRFFYNPSYLSRLFKIKLNKNYMRFVTEIRIEYAQECLKKPEILVTDVCTMCGYKSYKHFVKTFRSITNMTPSDYRKQSGW